VALLHDEPVTEGETVPLSQAWFAAVREACARTGPVPGVERYLLEWWVSDPPADGLTQLPWLFGVWNGHWVCWAGTTPWAAADLKVTTVWDRAAFEQAVRFNADPEHPPTTPWTTLGTSSLAVPTVILLALAGKPATGGVRMPVTPTPADPEPAAEPAPAAAPSATDPIPPPPGAEEADPAQPVDPVAAAPAEAPVEPAPIAPIEIEPAAPPSNLPPPEWYPDPSGRHQLRYWDGARWTEHAADEATGQVIDPI
jgi:hypothetical protein